MYTDCSRHLEARLEAEKGHFAVLFFRGTTYLYLPAQPFGGLSEAQEEVGSAYVDVYGNDDSGLYGYVSLILGKVKCLAVELPTCIYGHEDDEREESMLIAFLEELVDLAREHG